MSDIDLIVLLQDKDFRDSWMGAKVIELIALQVRGLRIGRGMSQKQFAEFIGSDQPTLSNLELGKSSPNLDTLLKIAKACDVALIVSFTSWREFIKFTQEFNVTTFRVPSFDEENL